jgi:hypothetical protein
MRAGVKLLRDTEASSGAAFFFLSWDILITLDDEIEFIWSKPWNSWIKWAFLIARYLSLALQLIDRFFELTITYSDMPHLHTGALRIFFGLQGLLAFVIMADAEIVMMARVYALYNKNKWVRYGFIGLVLAEALTAVLGVALSFPPSSFDPESILTVTSGSFTYFSISTVISQIVVLVLSVIRYKNLYQEGHWEGARKLITTLLRDGTLAFCFFVVISLLMAIYHATNLPFAPDEYAWSISIIAVTECRLILNLEKLPNAERMEFTNDFPQLTTILETSHNMAVFRETYVPYEES